MKTIEQIKQDYKSDCLDGRDLNRLCQFLRIEDLATFGLEPKVEGEWPDPKPFTEENVLEQLKSDVAFGFEKALNQRGLSAGLMYEVVSMWNWILENELDGFDDYAQYGLPLFKATAVLYGFENPIGDDTGSEDKYASD